VDIRSALADIGEIICQTSPGAHHNLTAFLVDMHAPGVMVAHCAR